MASNSNSLNNFSFKLFQHLSAGNNENFFISPFSISMALSMCYAGARSETAAQLKSLLSLDGLTNEEIFDMNRAHLESLNSLGDSVALNAANRVYHMQGYELKDEFTGILSKQFKSGAQALDFSKSAESATAINRWVEEQTRDKIKNLISSDALDALTRLVLVNAIYFKGKWLEQFNPADTYKEDFHLRDGSTHKVDMMKLVNKKFVLKRNPCDISALTCEFPYVGNSVSMTIILPHEGTNIEEVENQLNPEVLSEVLATNGFSGKVHAYIPKFKLEYKSELSGPLKALGAPLAFSEGEADFTGISDDPNGLCISKVVHQAVVEVNEEGTVAAAATGLVITTRMAVIDLPEEFKCDRPFLFVIHDKAHNSVLFMGKYMKPQ